MTSAATKSKPTNALSEPEQQTEPSSKASKQAKPDNKHRTRIKPDKLEKLAKKAAKASSKVLKAQRTQAPAAVAKPVAQAQASAMSRPMVPLHGLMEAVHRGNDDIPFIDLGGGNLYQLLHVDLRAGLWVMRMKLQPGFEVPRHYHTGQVFAVTLSGKWLYKEYPEVVNQKGSYLFEPAHSVHTLCVPADNTETTDIWFAIHGANIQVDDAGAITGVDDAQSALAGFRRLCEQAGVSCEKVIVHGLP